MHRWPLLLLVFSACLLAGCGDVSIDIVPTTDSKLAYGPEGATIPLGRVVPVGVVRWRRGGFETQTFECSSPTLTSSAPSVVAVTAQVDEDASTRVYGTEIETSFLLTAVAEGTAELTAHCGGVDTHLSLTVTRLGSEPPPAP